MSPCQSCRKITEDVTKMWCVMCKECLVTKFNLNFEPRREHEDSDNV